MEYMNLTWVVQEIELREGVPSALLCAVEVILMGGEAE